MSAHQLRIAAVATAYAMPAADVATWPVAVVLAFHRNAIARGYLMPSIERAA